ncbi:hypothetical protein GCM10008927_22880 [Amylibacter ulvae]|uniref:VOC domain-containing protein n=1 Tax=Paramylibacter ulvae TaxID=1651968 RepID=A0ABQ3D4M3_9RHOB|nr:VOC family protein [Amylibacter ulvae]GHA56525.1 hypothetical protein GCM10008927_22880 [Amylibacter ulvae]
MTDQSGLIWWTELNTWDADKALDYYGSVMGWTFEKTQNAGGEDARPYYIAKRGDQPVAGIFTLVSPDFDGVPDHWFTYLSVADIDATLVNAVDRGGKIYRPAFEIPGFGRMAVVADVNGAVAGYIQPAT